MAQRAPSAGKAKEMLANPPHDKPLSKKQKSYFQALAHGWRPSMKALKRASGN